MPFSFCSRTRSGRTSGRTSRTSKRASASAGRHTLDIVLKKHRSGKRVAAPLKGQLKEDPIADELSDLSDLPENISDHSTDYEDNTKTEEIPTDKGKLQIAKHGIKKRVKKVKRIVCPICDETIFTQLRMNIHMKEKHPKFKFCCSECKEEFATYNGCYRHTQRHYKLPLQCDTCEKRCQYPRELADHQKTHTNKGKSPCTWRGCTKRFVSKKTMWQHLQKHSPDTWTCKKCNPEKTFNTYSYYTQHDKGFHGKGFKTRCGEIKKWPYQRSKHQQDCTKCRALKDQRLNLPDNPRPYKRRNLAKLQEVAT